MIHGSGRRRSRVGWSGASAAVAWVLSAAAAQAQEAEGWRLQGIESALDDAHAAVRAEAFREAARLSAANIAASAEIRSRAERALVSERDADVETDVGRWHEIEAASRLIGQAGWCSPATHRLLKPYFVNADGAVARAAIEAFCACGGRPSAEAWASHLGGRKLQQLGMLACLPPESSPAVGLELLPLLERGFDRQVRYAAVRNLRQGPTGRRQRHLDALEAARAARDRGSRDGQAGALDLRRLEAISGLRSPTTEELRTLLTSTTRPAATIDFLAEVGVELDGKEQEALALAGGGADETDGSGPGSALRRSAILEAIVRLGDPKRCTEGGAVACRRLLTEALGGRADPDGRPLEAAATLLLAAEADGAATQPWRRDLLRVVFQEQDLPVETVAAAAAVLWSDWGAASVELVQGSGSSPPRRRQPLPKRLTLRDVAFAAGALCGSGTSLGRQVMAIEGLARSATSDWSAAGLTALADRCRDDLLGSAAGRFLYFALVDEAERRDAGDPSLRALSLRDLGAAEEIREKAAERLLRGSFMTERSQLALVLSPAYASNERGASGLFRLRFLAHYLSGGRIEARSALRDLALHRRVTVGVDARSGESLLEGNALVPSLVELFEPEATSSGFRNHLVDVVNQHLGRGGGWRTWSQEVRDALTVRLETLPPDAPVDALRAAIANAERAASRREALARLRRDVLRFPIESPAKFAGLVLLVIGLVAVRRRPKAATAWKRYVERLKDEKPLRGHALEVVTLRGPLLGASRARRVARRTLVGQEKKSQIRTSSRLGLIAHAGRDRPVSAVVGSLASPLLIEGSAASGLSSVARLAAELLSGRNRVTIVVQPYDLDGGTVVGFVQGRLTAAWDVWAKELLDRGEVAVVFDAVERLHPDARRALVRELQEHRRWRAIVLAHQGVFATRDTRLDRAVLQPLLGGRAMAFLQHELSPHLGQDAAYSRIEASPLACRIVEERRIKGYDEEVRRCATPVDLRSLAKLIARGDLPAQLSEVLSLQVEELAASRPDTGGRRVPLAKRLAAILRLRRQQAEPWVEVEDKHRKVLDWLRRAHIVTYRNLGREVWTFRHPEYLGLLEARKRFR